MPNNDYIKRNELIEHFKNYNPNWGVIDKDTVLDDIRDFPAADVEPVRHGRWIPLHGLRPDGYPYSVPKYFWCDQCRYSQVSREKYCPNCGAKMDEEADDGEKL